MQRRVVCCGGGFAVAAVGGPGLGSEGGGGEGGDGCGGGGALGLVRKLLDEAFQGAGGGLDFLGDAFMGGAGGADGEGYRAAFRTKGDGGGAGDCDFEGCHAG